MSAYLASAVAALGAVPLGHALALLAGRRRSPLATRDASAVAPALRLAAVLASLPILFGGTSGDALLAAALLAAAGASARPECSVAVLLVALAGTLRVGSGAVADLDGAHLVLGLALRSPSTAVASAAVLSLAAVTAVVAATLPGRPRSSIPAAMTTPVGLRDAVFPLAAALLAVTVTLGSPFGDGVDAAWSGGRLAALVGLLAVAALVRRATRRVTERALGRVAAVLGLAAAVVAVLGA